MQDHADVYRGMHNVIRRMEQAIAYKIESAKRIRDGQMRDCTIEEIDDFYLEWDAMVNSEEPIIAQSSNGVRLKPMDEFCPFCHLSNPQFDFHGLIDKLNNIVKDMLVHAINNASSLDEALLDTWHTFNTEISSRLHAVPPSLSSINGGARIDNPSCTASTFVMHFTTHAFNGNNILMQYLIDDADKYEAMRTIFGVYDGTRSRADLDRVRKSQAQAAEAASGRAMVRKRKN